MNETKKNIAIDIRLLGKKRTGDEMVFFHLTKEILALDKENRYFLLTDETADEKIAALYGRLECIGRENVRIVTLCGKNRFTWNLWSLPAYLFRNKIDVLHTQYILPLCVPRRTKITVHIHDVSFRAHPELIGWKDRFFLWLLIPRSLRIAALIIVPSQFTKDEIIRYYRVNGEKIAIVPNALGDTFRDTVSPDTARVALLREKYLLPEHFIIFVGTFQPRKNIPFLIEAFASVRKLLPHMGLVLVGDKNARHTDRDIAPALAAHHLESAVVFPGFVDACDLPAVMHLADVFAFPSLYEGFGIPLLEAMSQDVAVAASDIPSLREVGGAAALYFDPRSLASCAETLYTLCTDQHQREALQSAGRERLKLYSWKQSALFLFDAYADISRHK